MGADGGYTFSELLSHLCRGTKSRAGLREAEERGKKAENFPSQDI